ncbi:MAG TPA: hypothetical protein VNW15_04375 [Rhizomicrobium sp.]|jgi:hypothetical protein|nr:hypothetical protein [Rhizomicrobium sp.]
MNIACHLSPDGKTMNPTNKSWKEVSIPPALAKRPKDIRGIPIPFVAMVDDSGKPHFTVNDTSKVSFVLHNDLCGLCGLKNYRWRWFVGGPISAFNPNGMYLDPPMHWDCLHYALQVCPYLALKKYHEIPYESMVGRIDPKTLATNEMTKDHAMIKSNPVLLVVIKASGTKILYPGQTKTKPRTPYVSVEYWQWGRRLPDEKGRALVPPDLRPEDFL